MIEIPKQLQDKNIRLIKINANTKMPIEKDWAEGGNYRYTETEFKNYLKTAKSYGVVCGYGNLVVVDIENIEDKSVAELVLQNKFPSTFTTQTGGGGWHLYYRVKGINSRIRLIKNGKHFGEIQTKGNQCIGPGSIHPSGTKYTVFNSDTIKTINESTLLTILNEFIESNEKDTSKFKLNTVGSLDWDIFDLIGPVQKILKSKGLPPLETRDDVKWRGCHPVHGSENGQNFEIDIEKNTWYCFRCEVGGDAVNLVAMLEGLVKVSENCPPKNKFKEIFRQAKEASITKYKYKDDNYKPTESTKIKSKDSIPLFVYSGKNKCLNTRVIAEKFKELNPSLVMESVTGKGAHIYVYQDGYYKVNGQNILEIFIKNLFKTNNEPWTSHHEAEIVKYVKTSKAVSREKFKQSSDMINFKNGVYSLETGVLRRHDVKKDYFLYKIPWKYEPGLKLTKEIENYLTTTFDNNQKVIDLVQELFGYCLYSNYNHSGLFYLYGTGGNGKKVFMTLLEQMLGPKNTTNKSISSLISTRFATAHLYGKLLNSCGELSGRVLKETDMLKRLTGGDKIEAEFKGLDGFDFDNIAKIITACNSIPYSYDDSDGWYDRQFIIPFLQKFRYTELEDSDLSEKLVTKENMESLLSWAVEGLHRLIKNGGFTYPQDRKRVYLMYQGNTQYFVQTCYTSSPNINDYIKVDDVRIHYKKWCKENNIPLDSDEALSRAFKFLDYPSIQLISEKNKKTYVRYGMKKVN